MRPGLMKMAVAIGAASLVLAGCVSSSDDAATEPAAEETVAEEAVEETVAEETADAEPSGDPLVLGIVQAGSGFMGPIDTPARNALLLEVEKVNAAGGVNGQPITVDFIDTETAFERYAPAAEEVIANGANVLIVTCDYDVSAPAALVAEGKNILNLAPCIGDPIYGPGGAVLPPQRDEPATLGLHAWTLGFEHPSGGRVDAVAPPSRKFSELLARTGIDWSGAAPH